MASASALFNDIPGDAPCGPAVDWLAEAGIPLGCTPTTYFPEDTVTRAEMAAFLWQMAGSPIGSASAGFGDVTDGSFAEAAIDRLLASGTTTGCTTSSYRPEGLVTRAELFTFMRRLEALATS